MPTAQQSQRIAWLDLGKGFAMALVLLGHSMRDEMRTASPVLDLLYRAVYIFHMTYFFWMTGYTYSLSRGKGHSPLQAAWRRLKKQIVPWLLYTLLIWAVFTVVVRLPSFGRVLADAGYAQMPLGSYLRAAFQANNPWAYHLWFLYVLMLLTVMIALADAVAAGKHLREVCVGLIALGVVGMVARDALQLGEWWRLYDYVTLYLPVVCLGILMANLQVSDRLCWIWGGAGIVYIAVRALWFSGFSGNSLRTDSIVVRLSMYLLADLLLPGVMLMLNRLFERGTLPRFGWSKRLLTCLGRESMLIYLVHQPFCCAFLGVVLYNRLDLSALPTMAACLVASLVVSWVVARARDVLKDGLAHGTLSYNRRTR